jgi:hypothetical protein
MRDATHLDCNHIVVALAIAAEELQKTQRRLLLRGESGWVGIIEGYLPDL